MSTDATTEPTPIIIILRRFIQFGKNYLAKPSMSGDQLQTWSSAVRSHLSKIYGKDGPQLLYFPRVTANVPGNVAREELTRRMAHLERIVDGLENLQTLTQTALYGKSIFIGHGKSPLWRELKDFIAERLNLP